MNIPQNFKLMELFCGPGGLAAAARASSCTFDSHNFSIEPIWANDIDPDTCRTYAHNIKNAPLESVPDQVVCADVRELTEKFGSIDCNALAFGFPCNDFSMVGETKGFDGKYGPLYTYGVEAINARNPWWFLAENVGGLRNANEGKALETILHDLEHSGQNGYNITAHLYRFEEYGVPQARHRIIIVGIRKDTGRKFEVPSPTTPDVNSFITAREAIENPPIPTSANNHDRTVQSRKVIDRMMCLPPGENAWFIDKILGLPAVDMARQMLQIPSFVEQFPHAKSPDEIRTILEDVRLNVKSARMSHIYRRLDPGRPSYTLTGSGGGGTHVYHWSEPRALTNRERARLQTFEDSFEFIGNKESIRKQIGMAVPPAGARHIFQAILKTMAGVPYRHIPGNLYDTVTQCGSAKPADGQCPFSLQLDESK